MDRRNLWTLTGLSLVSMLWLLAGSVAGLDEGLVMLAPALLLLAPLLAGRYVGEQAIERARAAVATRPPVRRVAPRAARPRPAVSLIPRGGLLLAAGLATRPPPVRL